MTFADNSRIRIKLKSSKSINFSQTSFKFNVIKLIIYDIVNWFRKGLKFLLDIPMNNNGNNNDSNNNT